MVSSFGRDKDLSGLRKVAYEKIPSQGIQCIGLLLPLPNHVILDTTPRIHPFSCIYRMRGLNAWSSLFSLALISLSSGGQFTCYTVKNRILELVCQWFDSEISLLNLLNFHLLPHLSSVSKHLFIYDWLGARHHTHLPSKLKAANTCPGLGESQELPLAVSFLLQPSSCLLFLPHLFISLCRTEYEDW